VGAWGLLDAAYLAGFGAIFLAALPAEAATLIVSAALVERFGLVAVVVGFGAWWTYFDFAGHRDPRPDRPASLQWILSHLPLTAAIAAMGAAMVSLIDHAHDGRTPAATAWVLCAGAAVVLCATMLVAASLAPRPRAVPATRAHLCRRGLPGRRRRTASAAILGLALVVLLSIPWALAVAHRLASKAGSPID
jgi:low temperature requirement protein LtrA